jgi:hypothetical protein
MPSGVRLVWDVGVVVLQIPVIVHKDGFEPISILGVLLKKSLGWDKCRLLELVVNALQMFKFSPQFFNILNEFSITFQSLSQKCQTQRHLFEIIGVICGKAGEVSGRESITS